MLLIRGGQEDSACDKRDEGESQNAEGPFARAEAEASDRANDCNE